MINEHPNTELLIDYLHRELPPQEDAAVLTHLADCAACRDAYQVQARITERLRAHARAEERDLPLGVIARVRDRIAGQARVAWWQQWSLAFRPIVGLPVAAVLVLAMALGWASLRPHAAAAPSIAATYYLDDHAALSTSSLPFAQTAAVPAALEDSGVSGDTQAAIGPNTIARE